MAVSLTIAVLKSDQYLNIEHTTLDVDLQRLVDDIIEQAVDYLDEPDTITGASTMPHVCQKALYKQCAYEWRRRKDLGLSSQQFPDGGVNKFEVDEWLSQVEDVLVRHKRVSI